MTATAHVIVPLYGTITWAVILVFQGGVTDFIKMFMYTYYLRQGWELIWPEGHF